MEVDFVRDDHTKHIAILVLSLFTAAGVWRGYGQVVCQSRGNSIGDIINSIAVP